MRPTNPHIRTSPALELLPKARIRAMAKCLPANLCAIPIFQRSRTNALLYQLVKTLSMS